MVIIKPSGVTFGTQAWSDVTSVVIDREAEKAVVEWTDAGPHVAFADVPAQRVTVRVERVVASPAEVEGPRPGDLQTLGVQWSRGVSSAAELAMTARCVVLRVTHEATGKGVSRRVELVAVSTDGVRDPVTITRLD
ncbi:MAG: hypothetical protein WCK33_11670 [Phycisphaerae bacterium]|jgi:hypothetical protein